MKRALPFIAALFAYGFAFGTSSYHGAMSIVPPKTPSLAIVKVDPEQSNLLGYWKLDEGTGTSAADSSAGATHTGTLTNGVAWTSSGESGAACVFASSSTQYIALASAASGIIGTATAYSITAWVKYTTTTATGFKVYSEGNTGTSNPMIALSVNENVAGDVRFTARDTAATVGNIDSSGVTINDGQWHFIAGVMRSNSDRELYVDNVSRGTSSTTISTRSFNNANIGRMQRVANGSYFEGSIDQVRVYSVALTTTQLNNIYSAGK